MKNSFSRMRAKGQGGLVAIAITVLIALVLAGTSITGLTYSNAERSVVSKQSLQTYYIAQSGLQEAIATRMIPRSNYYNYVNPNGNAQPNPIYDPPGAVEGGRVYRVPGDNTSGLLGAYRYLIVGGDRARDAAGNYFDPSDIGPNGVARLVSMDTMANQNPFFVISNALSCKSDNGTIAEDALNIAPAGTNVNITCGNDANGNPTTLDELTLIAEIHMRREAAAGSPRDRITRTTVVKTSPGNRNISLLAGQSAFVPGSGWVNNFDFDAAWSHSTTTNSPARLRLAVFHDFRFPYTIYKVVPVNGPNTDADAVAPAGPIPQKTIVRLYFDGAFDHRSVQDSYEWEMGESPNSDCNPPQVDVNPAGCNVTVWKNPTGWGAGGTLYSANGFVNHMDGDTQILLFPPFQGIGATVNEIRVSATELRSFSNSADSQNYNIRFTTN